MDFATAGDKRPYLVRMTSFVGPGRQRPHHTRNGQKFHTLKGVTLSEAAMKEIGAQKRLPAHVFPA